MNSQDPFWLYAWLSLAAGAGAVTSLAYQPWQQLTVGEIVMSLVAGFSFAIFVTPLVLHHMLGFDLTNLRVVCGFTYIFGAGSNILLPMAIRWAGRVFGGGETR